MVLGAHAYFRYGLGGHGATIVVALGATGPLYRDRWVTGLFRFLLRVVTGWNQVEVQAVLGGLRLWDGGEVQPREAARGRLYEVLDLPGHVIVLLCGPAR
jgi:hypothetical protein